jgi:hypothetical protein
MIWKEVKTWATSHGYKVDRERVTDSPKSYNYYWERKSDASISGTADSTFNLAKCIYNDITDGKFVEHQENYVKDIEVTNALH